MRSYFCQDYFDSQNRFRELVTEAGGALERYEHPSAKGPEDQPLAVDVAVFGAQGAEKVFFNVNGVHGTEAFPGAAAQLQLIQSGRLSKLDSDVCAVLVHNINPWGWAHYCQRNEDQLDLNRNFVNFDQPPESDELHDDIEKAISSDDISFERLADAWQQVLKVSDTYGQARFEKALMVGQYRAANGLKFGGFAAAWSNTVLRQLADQYLSQAQKVAYLDWHTGLGDYGEVYELPMTTPGSQGWQKTIEMWGKAQVERGSGGLMTAGEGDDAAVADVNGAAIQAVVDVIGNAQLAGGVVEFGTVSFDMIAQAVILDFWVMRAANDTKQDLRAWKSIVRAMFAPRDPHWEASVLRHAAAINDRMLDVLRDW